MCHIAQFQNVNPERGRKLDFLQVTPQKLAMAFQNVNPERGRKRSHTYQTPIRRDAISEREPRKGTET